MSWLAKTLLSILPFRGGANNGNCNNCNNKTTCKADQLKRKCPGNEASGDSGNQIPIKKSKSTGELQVEQNLKEVVKKESGHGLSNSNVQQEIVQHLNQLTKLLTDFTKNEGQGEHDKKKQSNENGTNEDISKVGSNLVATNTEAELASSTNTKENNTTDGQNGIISSQSSVPNLAKTGESKAESEEKADTNTEKSTENIISNTNNASPSISTAETATATTATTATTTTTATTAETAVAPASVVPNAETDNLEKEKLAKEQREEEDFIKDHEIKISLSSESTDESAPSALCFSSPELTNLNLGKQIEFLQENVLTPIKFQDTFKLCGLVVPKGIYFYGPGIGSSALLLVKALATELSQTIGKPVRVFQKTDTDTFSKYDSETWKKIASTLFSVAVKNKPSIILIQDIDLVCNYCTSNILCNKDLVQFFGGEIDKIVPGEVVVIFTVQDLKRTFPALRTDSRFQKYLEITQTCSIESITFNLKVNATKWTSKILPGSSEEQEVDKSIQQIAELIFKTSPSLDTEDVSKICREMAQKSINGMLKSLPHTPKSCACKCCVSNLKPKFPSFAEWAETIKSIVTLKKANTVDRYGFSSNATGNVAEAETLGDNFSFAQVGGLSKQIEILKENILLPLRNKGKLKELGWTVEPVRGFIFHGPPGTGKTLLGKALAAELSRLEDGKKFSFFYHKGTDCFRMYVGQTEEKLREIFQNAKKKAPAIIFLDEIDGICSQRDDSGNSRFYNGVVTTMLGLMDNIPRGEVFVIAATNRLSSLDPALRRPGRFDKCVEFQVPKFEGRKNILEIHTSTWNAESKMTLPFLEEIADKTGGYTGADLEQLCRQAFVLAMRRHTATNNQAADQVANSEIMSLENLSILKEDWYSSLRVVRSSGGNYFGNSVISDKPISKPATLALQNRVEIVTKKLSYFLNKKERVGENCTTESGLNTFLIWGNTTKQQKVIDTLFVPLLVASKAFSSTVTVKLDMSMTITEMATALHNVINPGEDKLGVLYVPNIDQILDPNIFAIEGQCPVRTAHKKFLDELEVLRGERVLLLGTGKRKPVNMSQEVQALFRGVDDLKKYEFKRPSEEEIRLVLEDFTLKLEPSTFENIVQVLSTEENTNSSRSLLTNDINIYDLLDMRTEVDIILKKFDGNDALQKQGLEAVIEVFVRNLDAQYNRTSLSEMYT